MFSSLSPESLADSLEASTRDEGHTEEAEKKGSQEGGGAAGARRRPEAGSDGSQPRVQVSLGEPVIPEGLQWLTNAAFARRAPELAVAALVRKPPSAPGCSAGGSFSRSVGPDALKTPGLEPKDERAQHLCVCVCVCELGEGFVPLNISCRSHGDVQTGWGVLLCMQTGSV